MRATCYAGTTTRRGNIARSSCTAAVSVTEIISSPRNCVGLSASPPELSTNAHFLLTLEAARVTIFDGASTQTVDVANSSHGVAVKATPTDSVRRLPANTGATLRESLNLNASCRKTLETAQKYMPNGPSVQQRIDVYHSTTLVVGATRTGSILSNTASMIVHQSMSRISVSCQLKSASARTTDRIGTTIQLKRDVYNSTTAGAVATKTTSILWNNASRDALRNIQPPLPLPRGSPPIQTLQSSASWSWTLVNATTLRPDGATTPPAVFAPHSNTEAVAATGTTSLMKTTARIIVLPHKISASCR